jgi:hypothetical protein
MAIIKQPKGKPRRNGLLKLYRFVVEHSFLSRWKAFQEFSAELGGTPIMGLTTVEGDGDFLEFY